MMCVCFFLAALPPGRFLMFTSGMENLHEVEQVQSGERFVMSMWFTCDKRREFETFLDGKAHNKFKQPLEEQGQEKGQGQGVPAAPQSTGAPPPPGPAGDGEAADQSPSTGAGGGSASGEGEL
jgi:hypothetical protein